ncbi:MAG TPA: hypothetical protein VOA00_03140 [Thermoanaerobaculia bacterium]|nr:hypothetical protein [Thermoanaerobaculia bacterium]
MPERAFEYDPAVRAAPRASSRSFDAPKTLRILFPYAVFFILLLVSWNRWMEPFVDSGRELMVPRRLAEGELLYRDVHFHHGPLAPYAGALVERLAGRSFPARTVLHLAVALAGLEALRRLAERAIAGPGAALAAGLTVALAFFLRPGGWLFPFSVDTAMAVAAVTGAMALLSGPVSRARDAAAALCLFAALVSRPELGLAGIVAAALDTRRRPRSLWLLAASPAAAAAAFYAALSAGLPVPRLVADGWLALLRPPQAFQNVYRAFAGLDAPGLRLAEVALAAIVLLLAVVLLILGAAVSERVRPLSPGASRSIDIACLAILAGCALPFHFSHESWTFAPDRLPPLLRAVPVICAAVAILRVRSVFLRRPDADPAPGISDGVLFLALLFAGRLLLAAGYTGPYNAFFLPLGILVALAAASRGAERFAPSIGRSFPALVRGALGIFLLFRILSLTAAYRSPGWERLETPAGPVVLPAHQARTARLVLADLTARLPVSATLTGFPEAGFFEYALGARNPLPLEQFWPGHLDAAGEERIVRLLRERPPDALLLINALAVGEGFRAFGTDYSRRLGAFVESEFRPVAMFGPDARAGARIGEPQFFVEVRVPAAARAPEGRGRTR